MNAEAADAGAMTVRAIVFAAPGEVVVREDLTPPSVGAGDVEVRSTYTGVSVGTERNFLTGGSYRLAFPQLAGYQIAGMVTRAGDEVSALSPGDRVFAHLSWSHPCPGESFTWVGSHASLHVGPAVGNIMALPDDIPDEEAALLSIASIGLHGAIRGGAGPGRRILVYGLGMIGLFAAQAVSALGGEVVAVDRHAKRREVAAGLGADEVVDSSDQTALWGRLGRLGPFDAVLETSSGPDVIAGLIEGKAVRSGARIVLLGGRERLDYPFNRAQEMELELVHSMHHSQEDARRVMTLRSEGSFHIGPLITHRLAPSEVPGFWRSVLRGSRDHLGVVIDWSRA